MLIQTLALKCKNPIPWTTGDVPDDFQFHLFYDAWDHPAQHMEHAVSDESDVTVALGDGDAPGLHPLPPEVEGGRGSGALGNANADTGTDGQGDIAPVFA